MKKRTIKIRQVFCNGDDLWIDDDCCWQLHKSNYTIKCEKLHHVSAIVSTQKCECTTIKIQFSFQFLMLLSTAYKLKILHSQTGSTKNRKYFHGK